MSTYEESPRRGRELADEMGRRSIRLIVLYDVADRNARRDAALFLDLARWTGRCVLPFDANSPDRFRELLAAVAVFAVGGARLLHEKRRDLPGAVARCCCSPETSRPRVSLVRASSF
jgi:hypothetical protein